MLMRSVIKPAEFRGGQYSTTGSSVAYVDAHVSFWRVGLGPAYTASCKYIWGVVADDSVLQLASNRPSAGCEGHFDSELVHG